MEENLKFLEISRGYDDKSIRELSPLSLAFVGDAVYELLVRLYVLKGNKNVNTLHRKAIQYVKAQAQARGSELIMDRLTEEELSVFKRGRNANPHTVPKNAKIVDYRMATGLEALFGYLYLRNEGSRIIELFKMMEDLK
ncbi:MAG: ribonuclease III domain-containing protein [Peptoniphilus sp.]|nr:ribonuclease III domain-containing protein [Peptoniphilus sp.]